MTLMNDDADGRVKPAMADGWTAICKATATALRADIGSL
jgi:hypothetical protein